MPDIGTGGGMRLSVGIGLNLTGFEALTQIAKELETLQQMAIKTEQAFASMGNALRQTMNVGTAEMNRAVDRMERVSRTTRDASFVSGVDPMATGLRRQVAADRGLFRQQTREEASTRASGGERFVAGVNPLTPEQRRAFSAEQGLRQQHSAAIEEEIGARKKLFGNFGAGLMGGLGVTAALEAANLAHRAVRATGELDQRMAAMRGSGFSEEQISNLVGQAVHSFIPGVSLAEKLTLGQEIGTMIGRENVNPEVIKALATVAQSVGVISGSTDTRANLISVARGSEEMGVVDPKTNRFSAQRLTENAIAFQNIIGLGGAGGIITPEGLQHTLMMGQGPLRNLDLAHNPMLQAQIAVGSENMKDRTGFAMRAALTELQSGKFLNNGTTRALLGPMGGLDMLNMSKVNAAIDPEAAMKGGSRGALKFINTSEMLKGFDPRNPFKFLGDLYEKERSRFAQRGFTGNDLETKVQGAIDQLMPQANMGQLASSLFSTTGVEQTKRNLEVLQTMPKTIADIAEKTMNFNLAQQAVGAEWDSMTSSFAEFSGIAGDARNALIGLARGMNFVTQTMQDHPNVTSGIGRGVEFAAIIGILELLRRGVARFATRARSSAAVIEESAPGTARPGFIGNVGRILKGLPEQLPLSEALTALKSEVLGLSLIFGKLNMVVNTALVAFDMMNKKIEINSKNISPSSPFFKELTPEQQDESRRLHPPMLKEIQDWWNGVPTTTSPEEADRLRSSMSKIPEPEKQTGISSATGRHAPPNVPRGVTFGPGVMPPTTRSSIPPGMSAAEFFSHTPEWRNQHAMMGAQPPMTPTPGMGSSTQAPGTQAPMATPTSVISPTGMNTPAVGASPAIPAPGQQPTQPEMPTMRVSTIETNMLIVRGGGVQPQVGTNATGGTGAPVNAPTPLQSVAPGEPVTGLAGSTPQNPQKGIAQSNTPAALQSVAPGEPVAGLSGARPVSTGNRMDGHQRHPTGIRGSAGATSQPMSTPFSGSAKQFHDSIYQDIYKAAVKKGLPHPEEIAKIGSAQSSLETGFGKHVVGNNFFGIKAGGGVGQGIVQAGTTENIGGRNVGTTANFASFGNQQQSAEGYVDFLSKNQRYSGLLAASNDQQALTALSGSGYATDPNYGSKVGSIMQNYAAPNIQGPQVNPEQADVPASTMHVTVHGHNYLDGEEISDHVMNHMIGGGATASPSTTGYDTKMMPMVPGSSLARW